MLEIHFIEITNWTMFQEHSLSKISKEKKRKLTY